jgi:transposase-like protein
MGRPYSTDLRERVLRACAVGDESLAAIARRFEISESAVRSWVRCLRQEGRRAPKPHGRGFRSILDEDDGAVLRALVADKNDATLVEYTRAFIARTGEDISESGAWQSVGGRGWCAAPPADRLALRQWQLLGRACISRSSSGLSATTTA